MRRRDEVCAELRELPRHLWDDHLWRYCERVVDDARRGAPRGRAAADARGRRLRSLGRPA